MQWKCRRRELATEQMCRGEWLETVILSLLEDGADVNAQVSGISAVYIASLKGHWTIVRILVNFGADEVSLDPTRGVFERVMKSSVYGIAGTLNRRILDEISGICDHRESQQNMRYMLAKFFEGGCFAFNGVTGTLCYLFILLSEAWISNKDDLISHVDCYLKSRKIWNEYRSFLTTLPQ